MRPGAKVGRGCATLHDDMMRDPPGQDIDLVHRTEQPDRADGPPPVHSAVEWLQQEIRLPRSGRRAVRLSLQSDPRALRAENYASGRHGVTDHVWSIAEPADEALYAGGGEPSAPNVPPDPAPVMPPLPQRGRPQLTMIQGGLA
jgi:hypothetical protein